MPFLGVLGGFWGYLGVYWGVLGIGPKMAEKGSKNVKKWSKNAPFKWSTSDFGYISAHFYKIFHPTGKASTVNSRY